MWFLGEIIKKKEVLVSFSSSHWSVQDAKAKLSEILRRARKFGPQTIGTHNPCIVVPVEEWDRRKIDILPLGSWLVAHTPRGEKLDPPLDLPDRKQGDRPAIVFEDGDL